MGAFRKQNVNSFLFANNPDAFVLFVLFVDIVERVLRRRTGVESCRRQKKHAWKWGAKEACNAEKRKYSYAAPTDAREKISSAPKTSSLCCRHFSVSTAV